MVYRSSIGKCLGEDMRKFILKRTLIIPNFFIFILGIPMFGLGIWVLVDKPSFLTLFEEAKSVSGPAHSFDVEIYSAAAYILLVVSLLVVLISFFGFYGAMEESKCMLGTYFTLSLALFILLAVGTAVGYSGDLDNTIKKPLKEALTKYKDDQINQTNPLLSYKAAWNTVQQELKCCGVDNVQDWAGNGTHNWTPSSANKPLGCCMINQEGTDLTKDEQLVCRNVTQDPESTVYNFRGCYTMIKDKIESNQNTVVGAAIGVVVFMFLNMLFSFAMCTMVK